MTLAAGQASAAGVAARAGHCDEARAARHDAGAVDDADLAHSKCSSCASCCIGACAPPADVPEPALQPQSEDSLVALEPAMTAHISATPERPPRHHA